MEEAVTLMITTPGEHNCEGELWQSNLGNMGDELFEVVQVIH